MSLAAVIARVALRCGRVLNPTFAWWLGGLLGWAFGSLPVRDPLLARLHLARAFPERDRGWIRRIARNSFRHVGRMALWSLSRFHLDPAEQRRGIVVEGADNLRALVRAHRRGEGTMGYSGHFGNWELLGRLAGTMLPMTMIGRRLRDPGLDALLQSLRSTGGHEIIYQDEGVRPCVRALRRGRLLSTLTDQDVKRLAGVHVPWFGIPAYTPVAPAQLALLAPAAVQQVFCYHKAGRWVVHWGPRWRPPADGDRSETTRMVTAWFTTYQEALVRRHPEQWVWWHRRWRTPPPPGTSPAVEA